MFLCLYLQHFNLSLLRLSNRSNHSIVSHIFRGHLKKKVFIALIILVFILSARDTPNGLDLFINSSNFSIELLLVGLKVQRLVDSAIQNRRNFFEPQQAENVDKLI